MKRLSTQARILDAAEKLFSDHGFDGISMRAIAQEAGVDVALLGHYFQSKRGLFEYVVGRRAKEGNLERVRAIDGYMARALKGPVELDELVEIFLRPLFYPSSDDAALRHQNRLFCRLSVNPQWVKLIGDIYDPTAIHFIEAMRLASPRATDEQLYWGYNMMLGALIFVGSEPGRLDLLSGGRFRSSDLEAGYRYLVTFICEGLKGILPTK